VKKGRRASLRRQRHCYHRRGVEEGRGRGRANSASARHHTLPHLHCWVAEMKMGRAVAPLPPSATSHPLAGFLCYQPPYHALSTWASLHTTTTPLYACQRTYHHLCQHHSAFFCHCLPPIPSVGSPILLEMAEGRKLSGGGETVDAIPAAHTAPGRTRREGLTLHRATTRALFAPSLTPRRTCPASGGWRWNTNKCHLTPAPRATHARGSGCLLHTGYLHTGFLLYTDGTRDSYRHTPAIKLPTCLLTTCLRLLLSPAPNSLTSSF